MGFWRKKRQKSLTRDLHTIILIHIHTSVTVLPIILWEPGVVLFVFGYNRRVLKLPKGESREYGHSSPSIRIVNERKSFAAGANDFSATKHLNNYDAAQIDCLYGMRTKLECRIAKIMRMRKGRNERKKIWWKGTNHQSSKSNCITV